jgi:hypothetical protein
LGGGYDRIAVDFDGAGTSCKATVTVARQGGKNAVHRMTGRGMIEISSTQVGIVSCSTQEAMYSGSDYVQLVRHWGALGIKECHR